MCALYPGLLCHIGCASLIQICQYHQISPRWLEEMLLLLPSETAWPNQQQTLHCPYIAKHSRLVAIWLLPTHISYELFRLPFMGYAVNDAEACRPPQARNNPLCCEVHIIKHQHVPATSLLCTSPCFGQLCYQFLLSAQQVQNTVIKNLMAMHQFSSSRSSFGMAPVLIE